jgi:hypothetical protein
MSSILSNTALIYLVPSAWQMLRSFLGLFVALLSIPYRHRKPIVREWVGIGVLLVGLVVVALSTVLEQTKVLEYPTRDVWLGFLLVFLSQIIQATQVVIEGELLQGSDVSPSEVCAFEGIWGLFIATFVVLPLANIYPPSAGEGIFESSIESFRMVFSSVKIGLVALLYVVVASLYNQAGIAVTGMTSVGHRTTYEAMRAIPIWAFSLVVRAISPNDSAGEKLTWYSFLKLAGFGILVLGSAIYNQLLGASGFDSVGFDHHMSLDTTLREPLLPKDGTSSALAPPGPPLSEG